MQILECKNIREKELLKLKQSINSKLTLAVIQIGYFQENDIYLRSKRKLAQNLGIELIEINYNESTPKEEIIEKILELNENLDITGIMIQKPILKKFDYQELVNYMYYKKDVDGVTKENQERLLKGKSCMIPCTARAVLKVLEEYNILLKNRKIVIIGKSNLVGIPLYQILRKDNQVTLCDSKTENLKEIMKNAEIIISAIGKAKYFTDEYFKEGQIVMDVGTNDLDGRIVGDVDFESVKNIVSMITPVPGGVGQLTPIYLFWNLIETTKLLMEE